MAMDMGKRVITPSDPDLSSQLFEEEMLHLEERFRGLRLSPAPSKRMVTPPRAPICIVPPTVSVKNDSPDSHLQKTPRKLKALHEKMNRSPRAPRCIVPPTVSVKSDSPDSHLQNTPSETDSVISSVSMKSTSSMSEPLNFNPQRKQSCSLCDEAVKDPVRLLCGHWSCKQCVYSFRDEYGSTADYSCKKCGRRSETDRDLQSVLLEKKIKRAEMETEKFQAEKEKFELEKRKLALEIQLLEQKGKNNNCDHGL